MAISATTRQKIRQQLREKSPESGLSGQAYFRFLSVGLVAAVAACLLLTTNVSWMELLTVPITVLYVNLTEYWGHRIPMHRPVALMTLIFKGHTLQHHLFFTHDAMTQETPADFRFLVLPAYMLMFFLIAFIVPIGMLLFFVFSDNVSYLFVASVLAYYLAYEWVHAICHLPDSNRLSRLTCVRSLRECHRLHHDHRFMTQCNFNITMPIGDLIFGTRRRPPSDLEKAINERSRAIARRRSLGERSNHAGVGGFETRPSIEGRQNDWL